LGCAFQKNKSLPWGNI